MFAFSRLACTVSRALYPSAVTRAVPRGRIATASVSQQRQSSTAEEGLTDTRTLAQELRERGLWNQCTATEEALDLHLKDKKRTVYCGFDPTADSLHVGNLLMIITLLHFSRAGHKTIAIVGGATGSVGDPSGRTTERDPLAKSKSQVNLAGIEQDLKRVFANAKAAYAEGTASFGLAVVDNAEWYADMTPVTFLTEVGRHLRLNHMLARESVKSRLNSAEGISFAEFAYQALQAYDFLHLNTHSDCTIQLGGSDQWGNITAGCELIRRTASGKPSQSFGLTIPLLTTAAGVKFGKSMGNAVWLNSAKTNPYELYQFFINTTDDDVEKLLRSLTFTPLDEISQIMVAHQNAPELRTAQKALAKSVTQLVHGEEATLQAIATTDSFFAQGKDAKPTSSRDILERYSGAPSVSIPITDLTSMSVIDLALKAGAVKSKGAARRLITAKGLYLNNETITDPNQKLTEGDAIDDSVTLLRTGKKSYAVVEWER
ncbi:tyrosyl-tRNA synthetase [Sphaeroforma arctica JP610]|uniref:Tyrosine--tRNA ligase n=1 Tax=Sphaeroforma arctica JP610 TaxID=667725 RepID=A0A0L0GE80_9EUKA|nr:tyrosyl-tRNA synthetase [Sphaeroforma arctica JP610]KNC87332.1 tyrosyl-tRNA synthetase [Sphaeroforma arctica JP610]|eukprot:XP_014161234.1 tyrosyl-tRNA synthetase [Sphaeroforma arctica JP610]